MATLTDCPLCKDRLVVHGDACSTVAHHVARECARASRVREHLTGEGGPDGIEWMVSDDVLLIQLYEGGISLGTIARETKTPLDAIQTRLDKLRLAGCII